MASQYKITTSLSKIGKFAAANNKKSKHNIFTVFQQSFKGTAESRGGSTVAENNSN